MPLDKDGRFYDYALLMPEALEQIRQVIREEFAKRDAAAKKAAAKS